MRFAKFISLSSNSYEDIYLKKLKEYGTKIVDFGSSPSDYVMPTMDGYRNFFCDVNIMENKVANTPNWTISSSDEEI